jgi:AraC family transcriptional regulator
MPVPVTTGSTVFHRVDVAGFQVARVRFPPRLRLAPHEHERATVAVVLTGSFDGLIRSSTQACPSGTMRTEPAGEQHGNLFGAVGAQVLVVQPDPARQELLEPLSRLLAQVHHLRDPTVTSLARNAVAELATDDAVTRFALEGLVLELLAAAARVHRSSVRIGGREPAWLRQAREALHERCCEHVRVADIAAAVGVHPVHLTRTFHARYGTSVGAYLRALRLDQAAVRLAGTGDAIAEIAEQTGFYDQSHFTRLFKQRFGLTPAAYRRAART